jgi:hypothetical protein
MVDAGDSSFPIRNSFKPNPRSSFEVSNVPLSKGQAMIGPVGNLHLGSPERGDISRRGNTAERIGTRSSTMAVKALRLLQPAKGANEGDGNGSGFFVRHKKAQRRDTATNTVVTNSVVIPLEMTECLNKTERRQIKSLLGKTKAWTIEYRCPPFRQCSSTTTGSSSFLLCSTRFENPRLAFLAFLSVINV